MEEDQKRAWARAWEDRKKRVAFKMANDSKAVVEMINDRRIGKTGKQCRFGAEGQQVNRDGYTCGLGLTPPHEIVGLVGKDDLKVGDNITLRVYVVIPVGSNLEYYVEALVDGTIKKVHKKATVLLEQGVVYEVYPTNVSLSPEARQEYVTPSSSEQARKLLDDIKGYQTFAELSRSVQSDYLPLKIGSLPLTYWVGIYSDMKAARVVVTSRPTDYAQLERSILSGGASKALVLASYPVMEIMMRQKPTL